MGVGDGCVRAAPGGLSGEVAVRGEAANASSPSPTPSVYHSSSSSSAPRNSIFVFYIRMLVCYKKKRELALTYCCIGVLPVCMMALLGVLLTCRVHFLVGVYISYARQVLCLLFCRNFEVKHTAAPRGDCLEEREELGRPGRAIQYRVYCVRQPVCTVRILQSEDGERAERDRGCAHAESYYN